MSQSKQLLRDLGQLEHFPAAFTSLKAIIGNFPGRKKSENLFLLDTFCVIWSGEWRLDVPILSRLRGSYTTLCWACGARAARVCHFGDAIMTRVQNISGRLSSSLSPWWRAPNWTSTLWWIFLSKKQRLPNFFGRRRARAFAYFNYTCKLQRADGEHDHVITGVSKVSRLQHQSLFGTAGWAISNPMSIQQLKYTLSDNIYFYLFL